MQRRPKQRSSVNGKSSSPSKSSSSHLPRHHPIPQPRRIHQHSRKKKFNFVNFAIQVIIVAVFGFSCVIFYRSATAAAASGSLSEDPLFANKSASSSFGNSANSNNEIEAKGDVEQMLNQHFQQQETMDSEPDLPSTPKRSTEEANAYMNSQLSNSITGEKIIKQELIKLYKLQQKADVEDSSPIVTRYLGQEEIPHWLPKSSTSEKDVKQWRIKVERAKEDMRKLDKELFPELHGIRREEITANISRSKSEVVYPSPAKTGTHPIIEPTFGKHRSDVDAIFAMAEGYDLNIYLLFIESLKMSGFSGDLVLSVSALAQLKPGVEEYLKTHQINDGETGINVVAYTVTWTCFDGDGITVVKGAKEGIRKCALVNMYGIDSDGSAIKDPREPRPVATARFELYWAWSLHYNAHSWLMLIDSRDAFFQTNPFTNVERDTGGNADGLLYLFEENADASTIGHSSFNSRWLKEAYGQEAVQPFFEKPIICSGSTMGEAVAIESYLRGAVAQFDKTKCKLKGCDQGFHNYLYYSGGLDNVQGIRDIVVFPQGKGIINNLGVLRGKPLQEWGLLDDNMNVLNWDKSISPVAHQFDRDDGLKKHINEIRKGMEAKFKDGTLKDSNYGPISYPTPGMNGSHPIIQPTFGEHRSHADAVFALAEGYDLKIYVLFIESLKETGFTGDLVLSVSSHDKLKPGVEEYLRSYHKLEGEDGINIVAYTVEWTCFEGDGVTVAKGAGEGVKKCKLNGMYGDENENPVEDPYLPRPVATARYELYWAWSLHYETHNWIMLIDSRDAYFQTDPFVNLERETQSSKPDGLLYLFQENSEASNIGQSKFNSRWLKEAYGEKSVTPFFDKAIICSGSTMGEQVAMESYLRGMVAQFTNTRCLSKGCDQGFHNYLYYSGGLNNVQGIRDVVVSKQGEGIINNLGVLRTKPLKERGLLDESMQVLNWDKSISSVAHQWDRDSDLNDHLKTVRKNLVKKYYAEKN